MKGLEEDISIKVNIADVVYPLRVKPSEEENVRKAAKLINEKIRTLKDDYQVQDNKILLSMASLQFASELLQLRERPQIEDNGISEQVQSIENMLDAVLNEI